MKTLRQVIQSIEPADQVTTAKQLVSLLGIQPDKYLPGNQISLNEVLKEGLKYRRIALTPLTLVVQNLALFPEQIEIKILGIGVKTIKLYKGAERVNVFNRVISFLQSSPHLHTLDVVGFCEFWVAKERQYVYSQVADIYPYYLDGPGGDGPGLITEFDGGLMLLSRHQIVDFHKMIYRQCAGEDCLVSKGAIHARIEVPGHPMQYDIFLTHLQSCPPEESWIPSAGEGDSCWEKLHMYQPHALRDFITAYSSPDRPAILMGDLNHNGLDKTDHHIAILYRLCNF